MELPNAKCQLDHYKLDRHTLTTKLGDCRQPWHALKVETFKLKDISPSHGHAQGLTTITSF